MRRFRKLDDDARIRVEAAAAEIGRRDPDAIMDAIRGFDPVAAGNLRILAAALSDAALDRAAAALADRKAASWE